MKLTDRVNKVLEETHLMSLGIHDEKGVWVADVIFIFDENRNIFWMSDPATRHSKSILKNNRVSGTITFSTKSKEKNLGLQFEGLAEKIDGARYDLALKHYTKRGKLPPKETDDVLDGDSWYKMKLTRLYLIDEENFGFDRQVIL